VYSNDNCAWRHSLGPSLGSLSVLPGTLWRDRTRSGGPTWDRSSIFGEFFGFSCTS
jgi:hypothetical protein